MSSTHQQAVYRACMICLPLINRCCKFHDTCHGITTETINPATEQQDETESQGSNKAPLLP